MANSDGMDVLAVVDDRYELLEHVASGMAVVYRALDRQTGKNVALKLLPTHGPDTDTSRMVRESRILADFDHPGVVGYVGHGMSKNAGFYLATEWLRGRDLADRLGDGALETSDALALIHRVADTLGAAHARGVVHRDIKPSNLLLVDDRADRVAILDFGLALWLDPSATMTRAGIVLGTPGYLAPEQARADSTVDARADVFALGCVLFECLTGKRAFHGEHAWAVLAKVIFDDPPNVRELRAEVRTEVSEFVATLLSKNPEDRPANGAEVARLIAQLELTEERTPRGAIPMALSQREKSLVSVVAAAPPAPVPPPALTTPLVGDDHTLQVPVSLGTMAVLQKLVSNFGGRLVRLASGLVVATLSGAGAAVDQVATAARLALAIKELLPGQPIVLATGTAVMSRRLPVGAVIDRAARLLDALGKSAEKPDADAPPIRIDQITVSLLDSRFEISEGPGGFGLISERAAETGRRTVLGKEVPCVGRDREILTIEAIYAECTLEHVPRVAQVRGAAGIGKSRLREEVTHRIEIRRDGAAIWLARGDAMEGRSPFGLIAQLIHCALGLRGYEPVAERRRYLCAMLEQTLPAGEVQTVGEFLGETCGMQFPDDGRLQLRAAREDKRLLGEHVTRAWTRWIGAACSRHPVVLVLEDLQWGDAPSVRLMEAALRASTGALMVLAFARPSVHERFPALWTGAGTLELGLTALAPRAATRLVRHALGEDLDNAIVDRIVERAAGHPFMLEELIRSSIHGDDGAPRSIVAVLQARLAALTSDERRVLRAASVFGRRSWRGGVERLLAEQHDDIDRVLAALCEREILTRMATARFPDEQEYGFRHDLMYDAVYELLTDEDRELGHRLAGHWLIDAGEDDPIIVAEHLMRGDDSAAAASYFLRAATNAMAAGSPDLAVDHADRGIACDPSLAAELRLIQAEAHGWSLKLEDQLRCARDAMGLLPKGCTAYTTAAREATNAALRLGHGDEALQLVDEVVASCGSIAEPRQARELALLSSYARMLEANSVADRLLELVATVPLTDADSFALGTVAMVQALAARARGQLAEAFEQFTTGLAAYDAMGDGRRVAVARAGLAEVCLRMGDHEQAARLLETCLADADQLGMPGERARFAAMLGFAWAHLGKHRAACNLIENAISLARAGNDMHLLAFAHRYLAATHLFAARWGLAETQARRALELFVQFKDELPYAHAQLAYALLAQHKYEEALEHSRTAIEQMSTRGDRDVAETLIQLVHIRALAATGDDSQAGDLLTAARDSLLDRAALIKDPEQRYRFSTRVTENAELFTLANDWFETTARD